MHQGVARILIDEPDLGFRILREVFGVELPDLRALRDRHAVIDRFTPCFGDAHELRPDGILSGDHPSDPHGGVGIVIEAQRRPDRQKGARLWVYWALVAEQLGYVTALLVVALSAEVSRWAKGLGEHRLSPHEALLVLDQENMPVVTEIEEPERPGWAVLSALVHAAHGNLEPFAVAFEAALRLEDERRGRYASYLLAAVDEDAREVILGAMKMQTNEISDIERRSVAFHDGLREGLSKGKAEVLQQLVLTIFELRGLDVADEVHARISSCSSLVQLERWRDRAKSVDEAASIFLDAPVP
nr:hypothetical protein [Pseudenhygromyxa sp. WMMC2535]